MQVLFEREKHESMEPKDSLTRNQTELGECDMMFAEKLLSGVMKKKEELERSIEAHALGWTLERMDPISRSVLLIGAYEIYFGNDAPPAVVINEAIEIAKEYGTDESGKFVNGVLNAMANPEE